MICRLLISLFILGSIPVSTFGQGAIKPTGLRTDLIEFTDKVWKNGFLSTLTLEEYLQDTLEYQVVRIESSHPSFSWLFKEGREGVIQKKYQILVASSLLNIQNDKGDMWDSEIVKSDNSHSVLYEGKELLPNHTYYWKVRVKNKKGDFSDYADPKSFVTGTSSSTYVTPYYPLQKSRENPAKIAHISPGYHLIDFGKDAFAQLELQLKSNGDGDTVTVEFGEALNVSGMIHTKPGGTIRYAKYKIALKSGTHSYRVGFSPNKRNTGRAAIKMPGYIGEVLPFRYVSIQDYSFPVNGSDIVRDVVHYPFNDNAAYFKSSDTVLNKVWDLCQWTMKATSFAGFYVDGDRERIPYEADALINQLSHYTTDSEFTLARRTHEYLLKYATWPTEWILQSVLIAWNDFLYTGDQRSMLKYYDDLKAKLLIPLGRNDGLISTVGKQDSALLKSIHFKGEKIIDIVDWPIKERDGYVFSEINTVVNAYHYYALIQMHKMAGILRKTADAAYFLERAMLVKTAFQEKLIDSKTGLFIDGEGVTHSSLHANMFAMAFDLVPESRRDQVAQFLRSKGMDCSVYGAQFFLEALYNSGAEDHALSLMTSTGKRSWYNMIAQGATMSMEAWDNEFKPNQDWNHAWGSVPANIISRKLMGIEALTPGWSKFSIAPKLSWLDRAEIKVPTIKGDIKMSFVKKENSFEMNVDIPENTIANVSIPYDKREAFKLTRNGKRIRGLEKGDSLYLPGLSSGKHLLYLEYEENKEEKENQPYYTIGKPSPKQ